ncbi:hypothetical protein J2T14_005639 [Paenibacillus harenae]|nr:hypothetical protein [Paenibacillus harenae]
MACWNTIGLQVAELLTVIDEIDNTLFLFRYMASFNDHEARDHLLYSSVSLFPFGLSWVLKFVGESNKMSKAKRTMVD